MKNKLYPLVICIILIISFASVLWLQMEISNLKRVVDERESTIQNLQADKRSLQSQVDVLESYKENLESQINSLQLEKESLLAEVDNLESQISDLESQVSDLNSQLLVVKSDLRDRGYTITKLQSRLDRILSITVTQHYEWVYGGTWLWSERYQWDLPIPLSLYCEYYERARPISWSEWVSMAKDPDDDYYIDQMIRQINTAAIKEGFSELEKVNFIIAFVQSLPYTEDDVTTSWNEYPRYPIETLFDRGGDCEDTSILVATLLDRLGYDVALLILSHESHAAVGISIEGAYGSYYPYESKEYFYLETTGEGWKIGEMPGFTDTLAYVYPL